MDAGVRLYPSLRPYDASGRIHLTVTAKFAPPDTVPMNAPASAENWTPNSREISDGAFSMSMNVASIVSAAGRTVSAARSSDFSAFSWLRPPPRVVIVGDPSA